MSTDVIKAYANKAKIIFRTEGTGEYGSRWAGQLLPKKALPTAVLGFDGEITQLTKDPLPPTELLEEWADEVGRFAQIPTMTFDEAVVRSFAPGTLVAFDISNSVKTPGVQALFQAAMKAPAVAVALFDAALYLEHTTPDFGLDLACGGGTSFDPLLHYVEDPTSPAFTNIVVVTDGYAPEIDPGEPDLWTWLITPGGSTWPHYSSNSNEPRMSTTQLEYL